MPAAIIA